MNKKPRIAIVADDPPVHRDIIASGLCRVNSHLFRSLEKNIDIIVCGSLGGLYSEEALASEFKQKYLIWDQENKLIKFLKRFIPYFLIEEIKFFFKRSLIVNEIRKAKSNLIFCPCGVNPFSLRRAIWLSEKCQLPIAVYFVDDFLSGAQLSKNFPHLFASRYFLPKWMEKVSKVFVITDGLKSRFQNLYGNDAEVLHLPFDLYSRVQGFPPCGIKNQIMFIGNISHFYIDGIKDMASVIDDLNRFRVDPIVFRMTLPNKKQVESIGSFKCIQYAPYTDDYLLNLDMNASILCFAPYSFNNKYKTMVSTSFPSKILEYLASARYVIAYGPDYTTSIRYFTENKIKEIVCCESRKKLKDAVMQQIQNNADCSEQYLQVISTLHNPEGIANQIISALSLISP